MTKRFWFAVAAYLVPTFPLGYWWHLVIFRDRYDALALYRDDVIVPFGLLSMLIQAVILAWMYPRLFDTRRDAWTRSAMRFGAIFALLSWSFTTLPVAAKYSMTSVSSFLALESAFTALQFLIVSPLIAVAFREQR